MQPRTIFMFSFKFLKKNVQLKTKNGFKLVDIEAIVVEFRTREISLSSHHIIN